MTSIEPRLLEQLSAWMDGELPADEARFLQRRLGNDVALREQWERWQLAADCLKGHPVRLQEDGMAERIQAAVASSAAPGRSRGPGLRWLATAAAVGLAAVLLPGLLSDAPAPQGVAAVSAPAREPAPAAEVPPVPALAEAQAPRPPMSPLPSVRDFPLVDTGGKGWPRSPLLPEADARAGLVVRSSGAFPLPPPPVQPDPPAQGEPSE